MAAGAAEQASAGACLRFCSCFANWAPGADTDCFQESCVFFLHAGEKK